MIRIEKQCYIKRKDMSDDEMLKQVEELRLQPSPNQMEIPLFEMPWEDQEGQLLLFSC